MFMETYLYLLNEIIDIYPLSPPKTNSLVYVNFNFWILLLFRNLYFSIKSCNSNYFY
jgi:hypothetical protein